MNNILSDLILTKQVKLSDKIYALDPDTGQAGYYEVVYLTNHPVNEILHLTMEVTPNHPIYIEGRGWVNAEDVAVGDSLRRKDGGFAQVLAIERVVLDAPEMVYNFTVKGVHTYFVLEVGVLVHNCGTSQLDDLSGVAEVHMFKYREGRGRPRRHYTINIRQGTESLHTEQSIRSLSTLDTTISRASESLRPSTTFYAETRVIPVPNAKAAMKRQRALLGTDMGKYDPIINTFFGVFRARPYI